MNRTETIDALVNAAVTEISMNGSLALLKEFVRSGFHGFAQMTNEQLRRELSFWGLQDVLPDESDWDDAAVLQLEDEPLHKLVENVDFS